MAGAAQDAAVNASGGEAGANNDALADSSTRDHDGHAADAGPSDASVDAPGASQDGANSDAADAWVDAADAPIDGASD
jgi:hypothetical protein